MLIFEKDRRIDEQSVRQQVERFWQVFLEKNAAKLMEFYSPVSSAFGSTATRTEPGRLAAARREREYFHPKSKLECAPKLIEVTFVGDQAAVASYIFDFRAQRATNNSGEFVEEHIEHGRATQMFMIEEDGVMRIVHEHFSLPAKA